MNNLAFAALLSLIAALLGFYQWRKHKTKIDLWAIRLGTIGMIGAAANYLLEINTSFSLDSKLFLYHVFMVFWILLVIFSAIIFLRKQN